MTENNNLPANAAEDNGEDYPKQLSGKVLGFFNQREVVMDVGSADGVKVGMQFVILVPGGVPVFADNGKEIGRLETPKTIVKVVRVDGEHLSIGRTFMTIKGRPAIDLRPFPPAAGSSHVWSDSFLYREAIPDRIETFNVTRSETLRADSDLTVQIGDEVRLTQGDEFIFPG